MKEDLIFLFTGYGSEFTLDPLYERIKKEGYKTLKVDFLTDRVSLKKLRKKKVVFLTSSHLLFGSEARSWYGWKSIECLSPIEIIYLIHPMLSIYYPHDLQDQIQEAEETYLALFDLVLAPDNVMRKYPFIHHFEEVGYIKFQEKKEAINQKPLFLASQVMHHWGNKIDSFLKNYAPVLKNCIVKFPVWDYTPKFERAFAKQGIEYYPAELNSLDLMQKHDVIVGEGCSSTICEASLLGKKVVYLKDKDLDGKDIDELYQGLQTITYATVQEFPMLDFKHLPSGKKVLKPFNMQQALSILFEKVNAFRSTEESLDYKVRN